MLRSELVDDSHGKIHFSQPIMSSSELQTVAPDQNPDQNPEEMNKVNT